MKIRFIGIIKIDPNQAPGTAFLSCLQDKAEKFVVLTQLHRQSAYTWGQKEIDFRDYPKDQFSKFKNIFYLFQIENQLLDVGKSNSSFTRSSTHLTVDGFVGEFSSVVDAPASIFKPDEINQEFRNLVM